jgi:predicted nucleic acid-binding protein
VDFKVLLDASVLYPAYLRDLLLRLAERGYYQARWTDQILHEVSSNIKKKQPEDRHDRVDRLIARLGAAFPEARVCSYEDLIPAMTNHPKDRHVLAAAVKDNVDVIVTDNKQDFPRESYGQYELDVLTADEFLVCQWFLYSPEAICSMLEQMVDSYSNPPVSLTAFIMDNWLKTAPEFCDTAQAYVARR